MTYAEKLKDPRWQRKRLEVLSRSGFACESCGDKLTTLHVHHRYYISHRMPWEYPDFCYQALCVPCHDLVKECAESNREENCCPFYDWEGGLDYFGENIFDLMTANNAKELSHDFSRKRA